jgi:hypothetical protein
MTPHELNLHILGYGERMQSESENELVSAYLTAYYHRVKRMPSLKKLLEDSKPKEKKKQSDTDMLTEIKKLHAQMEGGK